MIDTLIECFEDTLNFSNTTLKEETDSSIASNIVYKEGFKSNRKGIQDPNPQIIVTQDSSFDAARKYVSLGKTAVLNFANPISPGGGVRRGAMAQEECLCRSSNLYPCLSANNVYSSYYRYHLDKDSRFSDRLIYTKDICVFKDDQRLPELLPETERINVDVITCAAPYRPALRYVPDEELKIIFKSRVQNIIETAIDNEVRVLILGAFGCGAFANPPEIVSMAFKEVIEENEYLSKIPNIVFAIKKSRNANFYVFDATFKNYSQNK